MNGIFEIYGTGTHNLGATLMAEAVASRLRAVDSNVKVVVGAGFGGAEARGRMGFGLVDDIPGRAAGPYLRLAPVSLRRLLDVARTQDVHAVLDASGFAYADAFGARPADYLIARMGRKVRRNQKLVLLPQAFGPFDAAGVAAASKRLLERADLVYARDPDSQRMVNALLGQDKARLCPDITIALKAAAALPESWDLPNRFAAIVPNFRMLKRVADPGGKKYIAVLNLLLERLSLAGLPVVIVLHSREEDVSLAKELSSLAGGAPILHHSDPLVLKTALGRAHIVVGSRFHALVSALSQGVPCLGLGWAHKYDWLFRDFGSSEDLVPVENANLALERLTLLASEEGNAFARARLAGLADSLTARVDIMWKEVLDAIGTGAAVGRVKPV